MDNISLDHSSLFQLLVVFSIISQRLFNQMDPKSMFRYNRNILVGRLTYRIFLNFEKSTQCFSGKYILP